MTAPTSTARLALVVSAVLLLLLLPNPAAAQDCGSWREPVLCSGEMSVRGDDGRWERFDPARQGLRVAPGGSLELELVGRDQAGRTFPASRLTLDFDDRDCSGILDVEDREQGRLRIAGSGREGRCRLEIWVPGNLNFAWRLDVEVARAPRTGYDRDEAEAVARGLYRAILGREGDAGGLAQATAEIQRGNLEAQIRAMLTSDEAQRKQAALNRDELLTQFYQGLLGRAPDSTGIRTFDEDMQFRRWTNVLLTIIRSPEFEDRLPQR